MEEGKVLQDSFPLYLDATVEDKYRLAAGDLEIGPDSVIKNHNVLYVIVKNLLGISN